MELNSEITVVNNKLTTDENLNKKSDLSLSIRFTPQFLKSYSAKSA